MPDPFEGQLIRLRARELDDVERVHRWLNNPAMTRFIEVRYPRSVSQAREYAEEAPPAAFAAARFAIETREGKHIGNCVLRSHAPEDRAASAGIILDELYWGGGYGTDAMRVLCRFGFGMMNLHRIELEVFEDNPRAVRCYEKVGFQHEGRRRKADFREGNYRDALMMGMLREEFETAKGVLDG